MAVTKYPQVHGEYETLKKIRKGFSICRIGDGEFKMMEGGAQVREAPNKAIAKELRQIVEGRNKDKCLIGIPTMDPKGTKFRELAYDRALGRVIPDKWVGWFRHKERFAKHLSPNVTYYSALITRPDCGEWMLTEEYAQEVQRIWLGKKVAVIANTEEGATPKILKAVQFTNPDAQLIVCPYKGAYAVIDELEAKALASGCELILASCGVTATCLTNRLSTRVQAVDIGSIGGFLCARLPRAKAA